MRLVPKLEELRSEIGKRFALYVASLGVITALVLSFVLSYRYYRSKVPLLRTQLIILLKPANHP